MLTPEEIVRRIEADAGKLVVSVTLTRKLTEDEVRQFAEYIKAIRTAYTELGGVFTLPRVQVYLSPNNPWLEQHLRSSSKNTEISQ